MLAVSNHSSVDHESYSIEHKNSARKWFGGLSALSSELCFGLPIRSWWNFKSNSSRAKMRLTTKSQHSFTAFVVQYLQRTPCIGVTYPKWPLACRPSSWYANMTHAVVTVFSPTRSHLPWIQHADTFLNVAVFEACLSMLISRVAASLHVAQ